MIVVLPTLPLGMGRYVFVTRGTYKFTNGCIDFAVYKDTTDRNMNVRMLRVENDWFMPKPGNHAEVATKMVYVKQMSAEQAWRIILPMMIKVK